MFIAALDQGTTSTRCLIFDRDGNVVSQAQLEHQQIMPRKGWVEHDPNEIWANTRRVISSAMVELDITARDVQALGVTNQRETAVVWEKATGEPIYNAIVWQDTRTGGEFDDATAWQAKTGLLANSYPAGPKIAWILDHVDGARERAERGELLAGTIDSWLVWNLSGGAEQGENADEADGAAAAEENTPGNSSDATYQAQHITDVTNASRTLLLDLHTLDWDDELCEALRVPKKTLPTIVPSIGALGEVRHRGSLTGVQITGILGDQQAAMFGQRCFRPGDAKNTYGTGLFLLLNTGTEPKFSEHGLLTTIAYQQQGEKPVYALEGSVAVGGSLIQWLRDQLGIIPDAASSESIAADDNGGVYIVPAFSGLFAPRWRPDAAGVIVGLTRYADRSHITRAALEATCFQTREVVEAMQKDAGRELSGLCVDGGMVANDLLMQMQADILGSSVQRPEMIETTVWGAALAAGIGIGWWDFSDDDYAADRVWEPKMPEAQREQLYRMWNQAVERTLGWEDAGRGEAD